MGRIQSKEVRDLLQKQMNDQFLPLHISFSLADIEDQVIFAICQEYVPLGDQQFILHTGDEVAIIPPLSGG